jgi:hypothetical protein
MSSSPGTLAQFLGMRLSCAGRRPSIVSGFAAAMMVCLVEHIFEDGDWAILEWRDPLGLWGCGFFHVLRADCVPTRLLG